MSIQVLAFDLDDTLYDESQFVTSGIQTLSQHMARLYRVDSAAALRVLQQVYDTAGRQALLTETIRVLDLPVESLPELLEVYRRHTPRLTLYNGYGELLSALKAKARLALLTDGLPEVQRRKVAALKLEPYMDPIIYTWEEGPTAGKPSSRPFLKLLHCLKRNPSEVLYAGDNPAKDFCGARAIGLPTVRVLTGPHRLVEPAPGFEPDDTIDTLHDLPALLRTRYSNSAGNTAAEAVHG